MSKYLNEILQALPIPAKKKTSRGMIWWFSPETTSFAKVVQFTGRNIILGNRVDVYQDDLAVVFIKAGFSRNGESGWKSIFYNGKLYVVMKTKMFRNHYRAAIREVPDCLKERKELVEQRIKEWLENEAAEQLENQRLLDKRLLDIG